MLKTGLYKKYLLQCKNRAQRNAPSVAQNLRRNLTERRAVMINKIIMLLLALSIAVIALKLNQSQGAKKESLTNLTNVKGSRPTLLLFTILYLLSSAQILCFLLFFIIRGLTVYPRLTLLLGDCLFNCKILLSVFFTNFSYFLDYHI